MIVGSVKEDGSLDKRISITPDTAKSLSDLGLKVYLEKKYAEHLGISDENYKNAKFTKHLYYLNPQFLFLLNFL